MRPLLLLPLLLLACGGPSREAVELAGRLRRAAPGTADALAVREVGCSAVDRACVTLWAFRGAACARAGHEDCALLAFRRAAELMPGDATADERAEVAIRLADAEERRRDRATGEARRQGNAAILAALAPISGSPHAGHYAAGVLLNRVQSGEVAPEARCATLVAARDHAARASDAPGLPPLGPRIAARRAAIAAQTDLQSPRCP